jgi:hypothetical protein
VLTCPIIGGSESEERALTDMEIENQIRHRAYANWEAEGRPHGRAFEHWLAAEAKFQPPVPPRARASRVQRAASGTAAGSAAARGARSTTRRTKTAAGADR